VPVLPKVVVHLFEHGNLSVYEVVREVHEKRLIADGGPRTKHGMPEPERHALAHVDAADAGRNDVAHEVEPFRVARLCDRALELRVHIEMIFYGALGQACDEHELLDTCG